jgi:hypothetical protein
VCLPNYTLAGSHCELCGSPEARQAGRAVALTFIVLVLAAIWWFVSLRPLLALFRKPKPARVNEPRGVSTTPTPAAVSTPALPRRLGRLLRRFRRGVSRTRSAFRSQIVLVVGFLKIIITFYQARSCDDAGRAR